MTRIFWQLFGLIFSAVVGGLFWLVGYMARLPQWGAVAFGVVVFLVVAVGMHVFMASSDEPDPDVDDRSGERPVWTSTDVKDRLSAFSAWANGDSILPGGDDTREMPAPGSDDRTVVCNTGLVDLRVSRPIGKHRAGARS